MKLRRCLKPLAVTLVVNSVVLFAAAQAGELQVAPGATEKMELTPSEPAAFEIEGHVGNVVIREVEGPAVQIVIHNEGKKDGQLLIAQAANLITIRTGPTSASYSYQSSTVTRRFVNGSRTERTERHEGGAEGRLHLEIGIPTSVLARLNASTMAGDVRLDGTFAGPLSANRRVELRTFYGKVSCSNLCSKQGMVLRADVGKIEVGHAQGPIRIRLSQGAATAFANVGDISVKVHQGNITIQEQTGGIILAAVISGDIHLQNPEAITENIWTTRGKVSGLSPRGVRHWGPCDVELGD